MMPTSSRALGGRESASASRRRRRTRRGRKKRRRGEITTWIIGKGKTVETEMARAARGCCS
jgi:hypothetical protein